MKLKEFVEKLKNFKPGEEITDMPAKNKIDPSKCALCKKAFKNGERDVVGDVSGTQFHRECFDKATNNVELQKRRTDNQLPYSESTGDFDRIQSVAIKACEKKFGNLRPRTINQAIAYGKKKYPKDALMAAYAAKVYIEELK